jgi:WD40 repeat protein
MTRPPPPEICGAASGASARRARLAPFWLGVLWALSLSALSLSAISCKKETESLLVVALTATPTDATLTTVAVTAATVRQTFALPAGQGLSSAPISFGVYLPSGLGGTIDVAVSASGTDSGACGSYQGSGSATVVTGGTAQIAIVLRPGTGCSPDGGADGGHHGDSPPSLARCTEYDHDLTSGACVSGDPSSDVEITDVAFTPDGKLVFTAGEDSRVKIWTWDGTTLAPEGDELSTAGGFTKIAVSPDGKLVAAGSMGGALTVWNVMSGWTVAATLTGITGDVYDVRFSPNSQILYAADSDGNLLSYARTSMAPATTMLLRTGTSAFSLAVSPTSSDGNFWLGVGYGDGNAGLIHVLSGALGPEFPFTVSPSITGGIYTMQFSPDGTLLEAGAQDGSFGIWSVPLPSPASPRTPPVAISTKFVFGAAFHPSGTSVAIGAGDSDANRQLGIWTIATGAALSAVPPGLISHRPTAVAFSPDGTTLVAGEHACGKIIVCAD